MKCPDCESQNLKEEQITFPESKLVDPVMRCLGCGLMFRPQSEEKPWWICPACGEDLREDGIGVIIERCGCGSWIASSDRFDIGTESEELKEVTCVRCGTDITEHIEKAKVDISY